MRQGFSIGLLQIPAFLLIETALGTSSSYVTIAAHMAAFADTSVGKMDYLAKHMYGAKNLWQVAMVDRHRRRRIRVYEGVGSPSPDDLARLEQSCWSPTACRAARRWHLPAASSWCLGARIADGCTTGHGISGVAQLAVGSTVAVAAMFAGAIATALLMKRV